VDWKAKYSALSSTRSQKKKLKQTTPVPLYQTTCLSVCLSVRVSATLTLNISETKRFMGSCEIGTGDPDIL